MQTISQYIAKEGKPSRQRITKLCRQDRIKGAQKIGRDWLLPDVVVILPPRRDQK